MVLPKLFGNSQSPSKQQNPETEENRRPSISTSGRKSSSKSPSKSTIKPFTSDDSPNSRRSGTKRARSYKSQTNDIHPLNLPPAERERRRSAMSSANGDVETDHQPPEPISKADNADHIPGSFEDAPYTNGDSSPITLPHRIPSPPSPPAIDAEECKALGNKYFKSRDYTKAIAEYTKG